VGYQDGDQIHVGDCVVWLEGFEHGNDHFDVCVGQELSAPEEGFFS
jgi:hypothetical protein